MFSSLTSYLSPIPSFPPYPGPHPVGSAEYEIPFSALNLPNTTSALPSPTLKFRLFYPTSISPTSTPQPRKGISWIPEPTSAYLNGYLQLAQSRPWLSYFVSFLLPGLKYIAIPAHASSPILPSSTPRRVVIFSHGLVGGMNMHSYLLGSLASHGLICATLEHRDGSCPFSIIRTREGETKQDPVLFRRIWLKLQPGVYDQRDEQLNIRLLELSALYRSLEVLNDGKPLENLAENKFVLLKGGLDLAPGRVIWTGHSFGGTTMVQLLKSAFSASQLQNDTKNAEQMPKIAKMLQINSPRLSRQILSTSPLVLLDPWFMPLRSTSAKWLFNLPLPCYFPSSSSKPDPSTTSINELNGTVHSPDPPNPTTIAILSSDFAYHSPDLHSHLPAIFTPTPQATSLRADDVIDSELAAFKYPREYVKQSKQNWVEPVDPPERRKQRLASDTGATSEQEGRDRVAAYVLRETTHVFASDFAVLFKWFVEWFSGQKEGELAMRNSAWVILRAAGLGNEMEEPEKEKEKEKGKRMLKEFYWD